MPDLKSVIVARSNGSSVSLADLLHTLRRRRALLPLISEALAEKVVTSAARGAGLSVSDDELQQAADQFRVFTGLNRAADTKQWLAEHHLSTEDLEADLELVLLRAKLADKLFGQQVERHFAENRARYDRARLAHVVVADEGAAEELRAQIEEGRRHFSAVAREHSRDELTRDQGGSLGLVERSALHPAIAGAVFTAAAGVLIGPIQTEAGHHLIRVEEICLATLDAPTQQRIREELLDRWVAEQTRGAQHELASLSDN